MCIYEYIVILWQLHLTNNWCPFSLRPRLRIHFRKLSLSPETLKFQSILYKSIGVTWQCNTFTVSVCKHQPNTCPEQSTKYDTSFDILNIHNKVCAKVANVLQNNSVIYECCKSSINLPHVESFQQCFATEKQHVQSHKLWHYNWTCTLLYLKTASTKGAWLPITRRRLHKEIDSTATCAAQMCLI